MRKSPTINKIITCKHCSKEFLPTGNRQFYCSDCKPIISKLTKQKWYVENYPNAYPPKEEKTCSICGQKFSCSIDGIPYCNKHYLRVKNNGTPTLRTKKSKNTYTIINDYVEVKTTKGEPFLIDLSDLDKMLTYTWCISKTGYLVANINYKVTKLHRFLLELNDVNIVVDHINGNSLDNRRNNLRVCCNSENAKNMKLKSNNSSGYQGIRNTPQNKFNVRITVDNKEIHVGNYSTFDEAVAARNDAELKYYGQFSPSLNR